MRRWQWTGGWRVLFAWLGVAGLAAAQGMPSPAPTKSVAVLVACWFPGSHPDVIFGRILKTYSLDSTGTPSALRIASLYSDKPDARDLAPALAKEHGFRLCSNVTEALTLGTGQLAVDGVLISTEWADYPKSPTGQILYPHRRLFAEAVKVFRRSGQQVPVFVDKHLADTWEDSKWIYDTAKERKIPLMAGSSLPVTWRRPAAVVSGDKALKQIVGISYHTLDCYGFHGMEMLQCLVETRNGGETGIRSVQCLEGAAVWEGAGSLYDPALLTAALERGGHPGMDVAALRAKVAKPVLFLMDYADGLRSCLFTLNELVCQWAAAWRYEDGAMESTLFWLQEEKPCMHFAYQMKGIESMVLTGTPAWPAERTLMTSGALDALLLSRAKGGKIVKTRYLTFGYPATWTWSQPPEPK